MRKRERERDECETQEKSIQNKIIPEIAEPQRNSEIDRPLKGSYGQFSDLVFSQVNELRKHPRRKS